MTEPREPPREDALQQFLQGFVDMHSSPVQQLWYRAYLDTFIALRQRIEQAEQERDWYKRLTRI